MFTSKVDMTRDAQYLRKIHPLEQILESSNYHLTLRPKQDDGFACQSNYSIFISEFVTSMLILVKLKSL